MAHHIKYLILFLFLVFLVFNTDAQEENIAVEKVFRNTRLINLPTTNSIPRKGFEFNIQHRFGSVDLVNEDPFERFFGLDKTSNIRFGFAIPVLKDGYVGIGRTKFNEIIDLEANYILFKQLDNNRIPVTVSAYVNLAINTYEIEGLRNAPEFDSEFNHRLSYYTQISISRKFNRWFSFQVAPAMAYKNLVSAERENTVFALPFGGSFKTSLLTSVSFEYVPVFDKSVNVFPFSLSYEIQTASHVFQICIISNQNVLGQNHITSENSTDLTTGKFYLGFNLHRFFYSKR